MRDLPTGTVTFLFTDIEGSTSLWERARTTMRASVERHLAILRGIIETHHGVLYKQIGDGTQAAFHTADDGLHAALDAQRALQAEAWADPPGPLCVRMALHVGEAVPQDGDYLAAPLNRLARLLAIGHGGQILLSQSVQQLSRDALPEGATLRDLGEHRLRDLLEPERVFQLVHPQLPDQFLPLTSLGARNTNLPRQPTPFLGRKREVDAVVERLRRHDVQLVTLSGPGGTGKTRLALQAAAELLEDFPDGVFFVPLASIVDPQLVPAAIAGALGLQEDGAAPVRDRLSSFFASKQVLLVVDNFEHLIEAAPVIGDLLRAAPRLTVLATSRAPLRLQAELEYPVPALALPRRQPPPSAEELTHYEAVQLFIARAQAVRPDFSLDDENGPAVAEICWRVDGLPLAIELAAALIRLLPPQALLARLKQRLPVLTGGARDAPARQQTLRATIAWSYDLLDAPEQALFRRLAVFAGGFELAAAEAVANPEGDAAVFAGVSSLVEQNLLRQVEGIEGEPRFVMLETIREFGLEQLRNSGEERTFRGTQAAWSLSLAAKVESALSGPQEVLWLTRLDAERDNMRGALEWASEVGESELALQLATALWPVWTRQGQVTEGRRWLERTLANGGISDASRAEALYRLGNLAIDLSEYSQARAFYEESLALCRSAQDERGMARALTGLGIIAADTGAFAEARWRFQEALAIHERLGDQGRHALSLYNLGQLASAQGELDEARSVHQAALKLRRAMAGGHTAWIGYSQFALGQVARRQGQPAEALELLDQSLHTFHVVSDKQGTAYAMLEKGRAVLAQGAVNEALPLLREATAAFCEMGDWQSVIDGLEAIARASWSEGNQALAARLLSATALWREQMELPIPPVERPALEELRRSVPGSEGDAAGGALPSLESLVKAAIVEPTITAQVQMSPAKG
jgi:predicted ATPase/class 3 adenylate cyclase